MTWNSSNVAAGDDITSTQYNNLRTDVLNVYEQAVPIGTVVMWAGDELSLPSNWVVCDGSAISRTTYADLYSALGNTFGAGDGTTTFNIPNLQDKFVVGAGNSYSRGATGGANTVDSSHTHTVNAHTHSIAQHYHTVNSHRHLVDSHTHSIPSHAHNSGTYSAAIYLSTSGVYWNRQARAFTPNLKNALWGGDTAYSTSVSYSTDVQGSSGAWGGTSGSSAPYTDYQSPTTNYAGATSTGSSSPGTGSGGSTALENRPPYVGLFYVIKTS